ncbi:Peptidase family M48 [Marinospirillum celere]|uniref:Peptidase family M48 n=1 Tax=Marinospirillum celere TaxID=1122252 RepID=A0A1I1G2G4_9GAMM|nr:M48 family metalloprotease [Marinospirillum celere]SFC05725.1 Peptidase family M48 [Marinospirillum celere]
MMRTLIAVFLLVFVFTAAQADENFRNRLNTELTSGAYTAEDIEAEIHFGRELASKVLGRYPAWDNSKVNLYINKVGQLLVENSQRPELTYRFLALDTDEVNAFAAPGGYVFITRGALDQVANEAELAAILAHEIGHIEHRHYVEAVGLRASQGDLESGLTTMLMGGGATAAIAFDQAVNAMMEIFFETGLQSHEDEYEADQTAVWLLTLVGYHPGALKDFFERVQSQAEQEAAGISRTHPSFADRIQRLESELTTNQLDQLELATLEERLHENLK